MKLFGCWSALIVATGLWCGPQCEAQVGQDILEYQDSMPIRIRVFLIGEFREFEVAVDLKNPDKGDAIGWGKARFRDGAHSLVDNCHGDPVGHTEVEEFDCEWTQTFLLSWKDNPGTPLEVEYTVPLTCSHIDNKRYWDWYYANYQKPAKCDYFQNCYGYAFDKGHWPWNAVKLVNDGPFPGGAPAFPNWNINPCYEIAVDLTEAVIAVDLHDVKHAIKVEGEECEDPPEPGEPIVIPTPVVRVLTKSWEQYRESGIYWQEAVCPESVDLNEADLHNFDFKHIKKK